jgi:O-antigen polysaccharide polymerase Wzy
MAVMVQVPSRIEGASIDDWVFREYVRLAISMLSLLSTVGLMSLVVRHEPLPFGAPSSSAIATVMFCLFALAAASYVQRLSLLSFPTLFGAVTFLFTCSPLILFVLRGDEAFRSWEWVDLQSVLVAMPVVALGFSAFLFGSTLVRIPAPRTPIAGESVAADGDAYASTLSRVGVAVYVAALLMILAFTVTGGALTHAIQGGYQEFHGAKRAGQVSQLAGVSLSRLLPWSLLILTAVSHDRRSRVLVVLLSVPALAIMLAIGDRSGPIAVMVIVAAGLYLRGARIGWGRSLAVGLLIAFLMPTVLNLRTVPVSEWTIDVLEAAATNQVETTHTFRSTMLDGFLLSTSSSYQTLMATVKVVPEEEPHHYGSDYLASLVVALPFRSVLFRPFDVVIRSFPPSQWVLTYLHPGRNAGPGYLQLAEAYLQFGAIGVLGLYVVLGWGLTRLWRHVSANAWNTRLLALSLIVMSESLIWVRNSSALGVRALAWGWLLVYVVPIVLAGGRRLPLVRRIGRLEASTVPDR